MPAPYVPHALKPTSSISLTAILSRYKRRNSLSCTLVLPDSITGRYRALQCVSDYGQTDWIS